MSGTSTQSVNFQTFLGTLDITVETGVVAAANTLAGMLSGIYNGGAGAGTTYNVSTGRYATDNGRTTTISNSATPPTVASGAFGEYVIENGGSFTLPTGYAIALDAASGATTLSSGAAPTEAIVSGTGGLTFYADNAAGTVVMGGGNNLFAGSNSESGRFDVTMAGGNDSVYAGIGNDTISGGGGQSNVVFGSGTGTGNLDIQLSAGQSTVISGTGNDTIALAAGAANVVFGGPGTSVLTVAGNQSTVVLGTGNDTIFATGGLTSWGGSGSLMFITGSHGGTVVGGAGNTTIFGGSGIGDLVYGGSAGSFTEYVGGSAPGTVVGGAGNMLAYGGATGDQIYSSSGNDTIVTGTAGGTLVTLATGNSTVFSSNHDHVVISGSGSNIVLSYGIGDNIDASAANGAENLYGYGQDSISGGAGTNYIYAGGSGNETLVSGSGTNHFVFTDNVSGAANGPDHIVNFNTGRDYIDLSGYSAATASSVVAQIDSGGQFTVPGGAGAVLDGVHAINASHVITT